jgi:hypothetical protein
MGVGESADSGERAAFIDRPGDGETWLRPDARPLQSTHLTVFVFTAQTPIKISFYGLTSVQARL